MIEVGKIYYLADQFGCKFIKVIQIGKIWGDDLWAYYFKSPYLNNVVESKYSQHNTQFGNKEYLCDKSQIKIHHLENLLDRCSFISHFRGCIEVPKDVIEIVKNQNCNKISYQEAKSIKMEYPFLEADDIAKKLICKKISKEDYRNMMLNKILN